jgi:hypothetical protein
MKSRKSFSMMMLAGKFSIIQPFVIGDNLGEQGVPDWLPEAKATKK